MNHNRVVLSGKIIGKFKLPYLNINAFELNVDGVEYVLHCTESAWDKIDIDKDCEVGVFGHLYHNDGHICVMADVVSILPY